MSRLSSSLLASLLVVAAACGADESRPLEPDAQIDDEVDAGVEPDAELEPDASVAPLPDPSPQAVRLSMAGADGFNGMAFTPGGGFVAVGYTSASATDRATVIAKFTATGALDATFGDAGVRVVNVTVGGGSAEAGRAIAIQPSGKIVAVSIIEADLLATGLAVADRDVAVIRLTADGALDPTFDTDGISTLSFNTGVVNGAAWAGADDIRDVEVDATGRIVLFGGQLTTEIDAGPRFDHDWIAMRLGVDGVVDTTFNAAGAQPGRYTLDILDGSASVRSGAILADGTIIGTGYSNTTAFNSIQPVIYKLEADGTLDTDFGTSGFFHEAVLAHTTEVYGLVVQGDKLVTAGYGKNAESETTDWTSLRINADGTLDTTWGDDGLVRIDFHGFGDNNRSLLALPDGRTMLLGSGDLAAGVRDAKIIVLDDDGAIDPAFRGDGTLSYDLGGSADAFWGGALSPDGSYAAIVGTKGVGSTQTAVLNDDAAIMIVPMH